MELRSIEIKNKRKKGSIMDLLVWLILSFIILLFFGAWIYGFDKLTTVFTGIDAEIMGNNIGGVAGDTLGVVNNIQTKGLHVLSFVMIFVMGVSILVTNFLVKSHPAFFIVYIFIVIVAVIVSVHLSNQYESLLDDGVLAETLGEFSASNFIMLNLPLWTAVFGVFGAIFLFMGILRDSGVGGSIV